MLLEVAEPRIDRNERALWLGELLVVLETNSLLASQIRRDEYRDIIMNKIFLRVASHRMGHQDSSSATTLAPASCDILCGKDKTYNKHQGNQIFREIIVSYQDVYSQAGTKQDKMNITKEIVQNLQGEFGARFLKLHKGQWQEISDQMARDKVSHALRFAAKGGPRCSKGRASHGIRRQTDKSSNLSCSLTDSSVSSSMSSRGSSSSSSVSSHGDHDEATQGDEDEMVDSLFERQRLILKSLRFDDHLEEEIGVASKRRSIIDKAIFLQKKSDAALSSIPETTPSKQPFHEFETLRSEDFDILLMNDGMDFQSSQEWALDVVQQQ